MDKNAYMSGETVQCTVKVENNSTIGIDNFNIKVGTEHSTNKILPFQLIRTLVLRADGKTKVIRNVVAEKKYPGTPANSNKERYYLRF
jgi:hypothetical protein